MRILNQMPRALTLVLVVGTALGGATACSPARQAVSAPSPLLDAVGLAPPNLNGSACTPTSPLPPRGWSRAALYMAERLVWGPERVCGAVPPAADKRGGIAFGSVWVDPRGRVTHATRFWTVATARDAELALDSVVTRAAARPATAPLTCGPDLRTHPRLRGTWWADRVFAQRAFRGAGYDAMVTADEQPGGYYSLHADAIIYGFVGCRPTTAWPGPARITRPQPDGVIRVTGARDSRGAALTRDRARTLATRG